MECDNLEEAVRFLRSALHQDADLGRVSRYDIERALEHVEAERSAQRTCATCNAVLATGPQPAATSVA